MSQIESLQLIHRLQLLQRRLCEMANDLGNLTDPEIVSVSEEADRLIVQLQLIRKEEAKYRKVVVHPEASALSVLSASQAAEESFQQEGTLVLKHS